MLPSAPAQTPASPMYPAYPSYEESDLPDYPDELAWVDSQQSESQQSGSPEKAPKVSCGQRMRQLCRTAWGSLPRLLVLPILALIVTGVFFLGAGPLFAVYSQRDDTLVLGVLENGTTVTSCAGQQGLGVVILTTLVKASENTARASVSYQLSSDYAGTLPYALKLPKGYSLVVVLNSVKKTYTSGDVLQAQDVSQALTPSTAISSYAFYPFDSYDTSFLINAYLQYNNSLYPMQTCVSVGDNLALFDSNAKAEGGVSVEEQSDTVTGWSTVVLATSTYTRTGITKFFSVFIVILMWALSAMVFALALDMVFIRPREPAPPAVGIVIATLFALPAVRNVQPDAPTIGARVDVVGFFWNMVLVGLAAVLLLAALVGYHKYGGKQAFKYV
eukprot:EG_transcript_10800